MKTIETAIIIAGTAFIRTEFWTNNGELVAIHYDIQKLNNYEFDAERQQSRPIEFMFVAAA